MRVFFLIAINLLQSYVTLEIIIQAWIKYYPGNYFHAGFIENIAHLRKKWMITII